MSYIRDYIVAAHLTLPPGFDPFHETQKGLADLLESEAAEAQQVQPHQVSSHETQPHLNLAPPGALPRGRGLRRPQLEGAPPAPRLPHRPATQPAPAYGRLHAGVQGCWGLPGR